jgi:hypothetical protein
MIAWAVSTASHSESGGSSPLLGGPSFAFFFAIGATSEGFVLFTMFSPWKNSDTLHRDYHDFGIVDGSKAVSTNDGRFFSN